MLLSVSTSKQDFIERRTASPGISATDSIGCPAISKLRMVKEVAFGAGSSASPGAFASARRLWCGAVASALSEILLRWTAPTGHVLALGRGDFPSQETAMGLRRLPSWPCRSRTRTVHRPGHMRIARRLEPGHVFPASLRHAKLGHSSHSFAGRHRRCITRHDQSPPRKDGEHWRRTPSGRGYGDILSAARRGGGHIHRANPQGNGCIQMVNASRFQAARDLCGDYHSFDGPRSITMARLVCARFFKTRCLVQRHNWCAGR